MQDQDLRSTGEHIWSAWLDLNYALADLQDKGADDMIRLELGSSLSMLRAIAEKIDALAASAAAERGPCPPANRRLTKFSAYPCRRGSSNCGSKCGSARPGARRSRASR